MPEVAKFLRVRPDKVLSWIRSGRLRGYNVAEKENERKPCRLVTLAALLLAGRLEAENRGDRMLNLGEAARYLGCVPHSVCDLLVRRSGA